MSLTASELESLSATLSRWEDAEYFFTALVIIACLGEFVSEFTNWFTGGDERNRTRFAKYSTLLLVASLSLELVCLVKTNSLSSTLISSLGQQTEEVAQKTRGRIVTPRFAAVLKGRPTGTAEIWYLQESTETYVFATDIETALDKAGWTVTAVKPIPAEGLKPGGSLSFETTGSTGLCIRAKQFSAAGHEKTPEDALVKALGTSLDVGQPMLLMRDRAVPDGHAVIIVGQPVELVKSH